MATAIRSGTLPGHGRVFPAFALIGWRWISRNPASAIAPIMLPFIFLYFLHLIAPGYFALEIVGAMIFSTQNIGSWVLGDSATWRIECALQDLFVASPMGKVRYLFGIAVSNLIAALPALIILAVLLSFAIGHPVGLLAWIVLLAALLVIWILFSAIGVAMSSRLTSQREIWPVGNLTFTVLGMLSPLYYPIGVLPPLWQTVARFLPTTYAALLVQGAFGLSDASPLTMAADGALLLILAIAGTILALSVYRWRVD